MVGGEEGVKGAGGQEAREKAGVEVGAVEGGTGADSIVLAALCVGVCCCTK